MQRLSLDRTSYSELSVKERALYVVRDHLEAWFQALVDDAQLKEMKRRAQQQLQAGKAAANRSGHQ